MGLTVNQLQMIRALAENRVQDAKKYAICCCVEDNTKKNEHDTRRYKNMLENGGTQFINYHAHYSVMDGVCPGRPTAWAESRMYLDNPVE